MELEPIYPFEPTSSYNVPEGEEWVSQIKWDGVRVLTYFDGEVVKLFNRKLNERTSIFPELTNIKSYTEAKSFILDGEVIALDKNGKPSFHEVMRRDGIRRLDRVSHVMKSVPIYYMIFDIVFFNGDWINNEPLKKRLEILSKIIKQNDQVQLVPTQSDGKALYEVCKQHDLEGIVAKNLNSQYILNGKTPDWQKIKNYKDVIAVIGAVTYRSNIVNSILIGLYDEQEQLWFIGHVGTGKLTVKEWGDLTKVVESIRIDTKPFINQPERVKEVQWLKPLLTVKVQFIDWPEGHSLRQPSIQAFVNQDPKTCKLKQ